jgi:hypothetical protein
MPVSGSTEIAGMKTQDLKMTEKISCRVKNTRLEIDV